MLEKKDWNTIFCCGEDPGLDVWSVKFQVDGTGVHEDECEEDAEVRRIMSPKVDMRPRDALGYAMGVGERVPTPIFLDGRYTPAYDYMLFAPSNDFCETKTNMDPSQQGDSHPEDPMVSKPKKRSRLSRFLRGIRRLFSGKKPKGDWSSL